MKKHTKKKKKNKINFYISQFTFRYYTTFNDICERIFNM